MIDEKPAKRLRVIPDSRPMEMEAATAGIATDALSATSDPDSFKSNQRRLCLWVCIFMVSNEN